jgi:type II secretory pathway pseudopilin PulG
MAEYQCPKPGNRDGKAVASAMNFRNQVRTRRGTTLVEMLVVIVIFLVGILAVVQIFPGGFRLLIQARKQAQAAALARSESERLTATPDGIPEMILPTPAAAANNPSLTNLGPAGVSILPNGDLIGTDGSNLGHWMYNSGANRFRLIESEHHRMSAPRRIGTGTDDYGCAFLPTFGLVDGGYAQVSGNLLAIETKIPTDLTSVGTDLFGTATSFGDFSVAVSNTATPQLLVPTGDQTRQYRVWLNVNVTRDGNASARTLRALLVSTPVTTIPSGAAEHPLYRVDLNALATANLDSGETLTNVDSSSVRIRRSYREVGTFSNDPFEFRVIEPKRGLLLFNPTAASATVADGDGRSPLQVVVSYATRDWRVLRQDVRFVDADQGQFKLPLGSIKTNNPSTPDSLNVSTIDSLPDDPIGYQSPLASHFAIIDLETGGLVAEQTKADGRQLIQVDKAAGVFRFIDADPSTPTMDITIALPTGGIRTVGLTGRALRVLYEVKEEWSVQVTRAASRYSASGLLPDIGQYYIGGTNSGLGGAATRIYFPAVDASQSVNVDKIAYIRAGGGRGEISATRFNLRYRTGDPVNLPSLDIREAASDAIGFDFDAAPAVSGVRGSSIQVRTLWNPDQVSLGTDTDANMAKINTWGQGWRNRLTQVFIDGGAGK